MTKWFRGVAARLLRLPVRLIPIESMLRLSQRTSSILAGALFLRDWQLQVDGRPQFFKHQINLCRWPTEPSRWAFTARGVHAREAMFSGCKVLDLCCGDGSYSFLFFSDIAGSIDAVDNDPGAIAYANRYNSAPAIIYHRLDIVSQPLPRADYDVVVWNAAICYFTEAEIRSILRKLVSAGAPGFRLTGMLPRANGWVDHKTEFADSGSVARLLGEFFESISITDVSEASDVTFYFQASRPVDATADSRTLSAQPIKSGSDE
jgi:SAM-dependent methyltransferase